MGARILLPLRAPGSVFADTSAAARLAAVQRLVRNAVPDLADFSLVYLARGATIRCIAAAHATASGTRLLRALIRAYRVRRSDRDSTVAEVIRAARPVVRTDIATEFISDRPATDRDIVADLHRRLAPRSVLAVPVVSGKSVLGALSLCYSQSARSYTARDLPAAMRLAARIGRALTGREGADATLRLRPPARDARQGPSARRRMAPRNQI